MSVTKRMGSSNLRSNVQDKLYREERDFRADKLVEKWSRIPEVGANIKNFSESAARNVAIHLENQARFMSRLDEAQTSQSFQGFSPENMLRLVRLAMPNTIRNKLFTEFAMESSKDSIKYIRPVYTETATGQDMSDRVFGDFNMDGDNEIQGDNYRKAMYESTEDRYTQELANAITAAPDTAIENKFYAGADISIDADADAYLVAFVGEEKQAFGQFKYIDGYSAIFGKGGEKNPLAIQAKTGGNLANNGDWMVKPGLNIAVEATDKPNVFKITSTDSFAKLLVELDGGAVQAYGRFDSEKDFEGDSLGEVEIVMTDYWFRPRPTSIGVTWSQLTELVLDTSFGITAETLLVDYAGQEIKKALDFRAVKIAYQAAKMNGNGYTVSFDAEAGNNNDDSYLHTAQTFSQAIERVGDVMYNELNRGGVSRIVGGPAAVTYLRLNSGFSTKGAQTRVGGHQVGELYGIPVFKVPSSVIPDEELICIWKNDENEADVSVAFGTLIPFFSTGVIQRKNFYKQSAMATYGDYAILNKKYIGLIKIKNLRQLQ